MDGINSSPSLLYPDASRSDRNVKRAKDAARDLGLDGYFDMKSSDLSEFFTSDAETLAYRAEVFADIEKVPESLEALRRAVPIMTDITDLRRLGADAGTAEEYLYSVTEVELYVSLLDMLSSRLLPLEEKLSSRGMKEICRRVRELSSGDGYRDITDRLSEITSRVREIKSVTLGVNLDGRLLPESAGLVSVNGEKFSSGQKIEKILKLDFKESDHAFIAPVTKSAKLFSDADAEAFNKSVLSALGAVYKSSFKTWRRAVASYILENTDFLLSALPEIEFLTKAEEYLGRLKERGVSLSFPKILQDGRVLIAKGLANPVIALATDGEIVPNDVTFDENAGAYILTGPNRGGKSVFTSSVGIACLMAELGMPVAAESFEFSVCDGVFCHFPSGDDTVERGRLGEECERLSEIVNEVTPQSVVLLDESLSSTGSLEASEIAKDVLAGLASRGVRVIFSTHLHTLAADTDAINELSLSRGGVKVDNLVAEIADGVRSFRIVRRAPEGKSYASDVAEKYGLTFEKIAKKAVSHE